MDTEYLISISLEIVHFCSISYNIATPSIQNLLQIKQILIKILEILNFFIRNILWFITLASLIAVTQGRRELQKSEESRAKKYR